MRLTPNRKNLLELLRDLRLADLELLTLLLSNEKPNGYAFGPHGIKRSCQKLYAEGLIRRLWWYRDPRLRHDRGSARQVFLLSTKGAERIDAANASWFDERFDRLNDPRRYWVLAHELMIARFHGAIRNALDGWHQGGEGEQIKGRGFRLSPDARFSYRGRHYFLEADSGTERIDSDDANRRTIVGKLRRYCIAERDAIPQEQFSIRGFNVVFVVPRRPEPERRSGRERSMLDAFDGARKHWKVREDFFSVISETDVLDALTRRVPLDFAGATVGAARPVPVSPTRPHARP